MNYRYLTYQGETLHLSAWAKRHGLPPKTLHYRLARGWSLQRALDTPAHKHCKIYEAIVAYEARQQEEGRA